ncbi:MAG TPA: hypothetical protein H9800_00110 [Candidatus Microbacterium stercoravium]|uniref:Uncharacterized protein n=1 Tax=Candidatus Microbacterium stercoravium TaxID=2838697 RepID=A0A9D2H272_9MICO|nr:hypothetical protein [Candidatus Microbacterium stercoravium]
MSSPQPPDAHPPYPAGPYAPPLRPRSAGPAITAFALAVGVVVLSHVMYLVQLLAIARFDVSPSVATAYVGVASVGIALLAVAALMLGIFSLRSGRPVLTGIAIGVSAAHLIAQFVSLLTPLLLP